MQPVFDKFQLSLSCAAFHQISAMITTRNLYFSSNPFTSSNKLTVPVHRDYSDNIATTSNLQLTTPSSYPIPPWGVFLNFYGKDTRDTFIKALYSALVQAGIRTFRDDTSLEIGDEVTAGLHIAIRNSHKFVVVLSENYARSTWCLSELVDILNCRGKCHLIFPIFYYVDPSVVRYQNGSYGKALEGHKKYDRNNPIELWKSALYAISMIRGYHLKKDPNKNELDAIQEIVEIVARQASPNVIDTDKCLFGVGSPDLIDNDKCLLGLGSAVKKMNKEFSMESYDVRALAICGMGGIGKTTTAKAFYNRYSHKFEICCFIENSRHISDGVSPLLILLNKLLNHFLRRRDYKVGDVESALGALKQILCFKKALIVVDDLDPLRYSELLATLGNLLSAGSRIIITTREANPLKQLKVDIPVDMYMVKVLGEKDSLELFSYHAFRKPMPPESFRELSLNFVSYAKGLPLALKVLGSSLLGRTDLSIWKAKLEKIRAIPENDILEILQLSYDQLGDEKLKKMFLDIVFYFIGKDKDDAVHAFKSCDYNPEVGISILEDRCLLTIDKNNKFQTHNLIQLMGREVGHRKRTHLYLGGVDAYEALHCIQEKETVEVLILDLTISRRTRISAEIFKCFPNLRFLEIISTHEVSGSFKNSLHNLRCIRWHHCPWKHLPSSFRPQKLVFLDMPFSKFRILWKRPLVSLKIIDVSYSENLKTTPDFTNIKVVVKLLLRGCKTLSKVHPSIAQLTDLVHLDLGECLNLKRFPESVEQLINLESMDVGGCSSMERLPDQIGEMKGLKTIDVSCTAIEQLPDSITHLRELEELNLSGCKKLRKLPEQFGNIESLRIFDASCSAIEQLPESFGDLVNLVELDLKYCKTLKSHPRSMQKLKLVEYAMLSRAEALAP